MFCDHSIICCHSYHVSPSSYLSLLQIKYFTFLTISAVPCVQPSTVVP